MAESRNGTSLARPAVLRSDPSGKSKGYRGIAMEGFIARWYARTRGSAPQLAEWGQLARELTEGLPDRAEVLEVAPGPGYFAIEIARLGRVSVTGLDISHTFIEIATENARQAGVHPIFRYGDASRMPFPDGAFDLVVCQAAFKNFSRPQSAVDEMHRVLRPGGRAWIQDMRRDATDSVIREEVRAMHLGGFRSFMTRRALLSLRRRAYTVEEFAAFSRASPFGNADIGTSGIGVEVRLMKQPRSS
jgi:ubiquinone/menaquinone biosynthesis C-methylase UbiE